MTAPQAKMPISVYHYLWTWKPNKRVYGNYIVESKHIWKIIAANCYKIRWLAATVSDFPEFRSHFVKKIGEKWLILTTIERTFTNINKILFRRHIAKFYETLARSVQTRVNLVDLEQCRKLILGCKDRRWSNRERTFQHLDNQQSQPPNAHPPGASKYLCGRIRGLQLDFLHCAYVCSNLCSYF